MEVLDLSKLSIKHVKLINIISKIIVEDFNDLIEDIYNSTDKSIDWLVNSTLSRNTYLSSIFINICYLELIREVLSEKKIQKIIVTGAGLKKTLVNHLREKKLNIKVINKQTLVDRMKKKLRPFYALLLNIYTFALHWSFKDKDRTKRINSNEEITLVDTFFLHNMFNNNKYNDRYYNGLLEFLSEEEKKKVFFVPSILINYGLKKILCLAEKAEENFIFKSDYLKISDYIFSLLSPFRIKRISFNKFKFNDFNIGPMLQADFRYNICNESSLLGILNYRFIKRLKENNIKSNLVIDWFENQVIDRGFNKGISDFYPDTYSVGYQGYIISSDYNFYIYPTEYEVKSGVIPSEISVVGRALVDSTNKFFTNLKVSVAPAFRFKGVWEEFESRPTSDKITILVSLPIALKESCEILHLINDSVQLGNFNNINFHVKPHPTLRIGKIMGSFDSWPGEFTIVSGSFKDRLQESGIVISNTSSTCLEALAMGIPVIIIGSQSGITQNPIPERFKEDIWRLCYTAEELVDTINFYLSQLDKDRIRYKAIGKIIKKECFEPVNEKSVKSFLGLNS